MAHAPRESLVSKLGLRPGTRGAILSAPATYLDALAPLPAGVSTSGALDADLHFIQSFAGERRALEGAFPALTGALAPSGALWICWPKRSSGVQTDLNENVVREIGLRAGLVDVKVISIDAVWSGLKFVYRIADRGPIHGP